MISMKNVSELRYLLNIYFYVGAMAFILSLLVYFYFSSNQAIQLINTSIAPNINITYQISSSPSLDILKVVVGSSLTAIVPLALFGAKLEKDKHDTITAVMGMISNNSGAAHLILQSLEYEIQCINSDSNYQEFKHPLLDLLPFSELVFKNIDYFVEDYLYLIGISSKVDYLIKGLNYREDLILRSKDKNKLSIIKQQDGYLINELKGLIDSINKFEKDEYGEVIT